jgi:hypothetical protein
MAYKLIESAQAKIGVLVVPNGGMVAVALAAPPDSGKFMTAPPTSPRWPAG